MLAKNISTFFSYLWLWREERFDVNESVLTLCLEVVVSESAGDSDGGQQPTPLALPVNDRELEVVLER